MRYKHLQKDILYISLARVFVLMFAILLAGQSCASKRHSKQAQKLEDAGLYEMAADRYLRSYNANRNNIEALAGLRRNGQRAIEAKAALVGQAWFSGNDRETVYRYLEVLAYQQRVRNAGIDLKIPEQAVTYYEDVRPRFLERSFEEARLLIEEESFSQAESKLSEIKRIDPSYQDLDQYIRISRSEPLYRLAVEHLDNRLYRSAYDTFTSLINSHGSYKDAAELREDALNMGRLTIAVADLKNSTRQRNAQVVLRNRIVSEISNLSNPFIVIVDDRNTQAFLKEQEMAARLGSEMKIGGLMAAKSLLSGELLNFSVVEGRPETIERRGFLKEVLTSENSETGEKTSRTIYHKITYREYRKENKASGSLQFQLSSTETGTVLISEYIEVSLRDQVNYAIFEGNHENIVPGHWEFPDRDSPKDNVLDDKGHVQRLQDLFSANQEIKPAGVIHNEVVEGIAVKVREAVYAYNPER